MPYMRVKIIPNVETWEDALVYINRKRKRGHNYVKKRGEEIGLYFGDQAVFIAANQEELEAYIWGLASGIFVATLK